MDELIQSRKTAETDLRRYKATHWLVSLFGPLGIPDQPSEKEFLSCLRSDFILCNLLHKLRPVSFPKIEGVTSSSHSLPSSSVKHFQNIQNFISVTRDLDIPVPDASVFNEENFEEGSSTKLVDCILALEYYCKGKQLEITMPTGPESEPERVRAGLNLSWRAWTLTWETRFDLARCLLGATAMICSVSATYYCLSVQYVIEKETEKSESMIKDFAGLVVMTAIMCMPFVMSGKYYLMHVYIPQQSSEIRKRWIWGTRLVMLLITSLTMWASVVVTLIEVDGKEAVISTGFLLTSAVLCEAVFLDDDGGGLTELIICFLLMQVRKTFKLNMIFLLFIAILCYVVKIMVMLAMKELQKRARRARRVREGETKTSKVHKLILLRNTTHDKLRDHHNIDVDTALPELIDMSNILDTMEQEED